LAKTLQNIQGFALNLFGVGQTQIVEFSAAWPSLELRLPKPLPNLFPIMAESRAQGKVKAF